MRGTRGWIGSLLVTTVVAACAADPAGSPEAVFSPSEVAVAPTINLYGVGGLRSAGPQSPCQAGPWREFDFWVGDWNVFNEAGTQIGTNAVTVELDGCVVAEHWTASGGTRGRSINTYDAETGQWHQTWVSQFTFGHLRMAGGLVGNVMTLHGERIRPGPFGFTIFDDYSWTPLDDGRVLQVGIFDLPAFGIRSEFRGFYERTDDLVPAPEAPGAECAPGGVSARTRELDFLLGSWAVAADPGPPLGESAVGTDLSDCLIEERFSTDKGYEAVSFTYYDRVELVFYRTYIDSEGERLELHGDFVGDALVLTGTDGVPGGEVELRVTLRPDGADGLTQQIEISRDGGLTWQEGVTLAYTT